MNLRNRLYTGKSNVIYFFLFTLLLSSIPLMGIAETEKIKKGGQHILPPSVIPHNHILKPTSPLSDKGKSRNLYLHGKTIDTEKQKPLTPPQDNESRHLHIIQFTGPIKSKWSKALAEIKEIQVSSYVPDNAYIVYATSSNIKRLKQHTILGPAIQWISYFPAEFKIHNQLKRTKTSEVPVTIKLFQDSSNKKTIAFIKRIAGKLTTKPWLVGKFIYVRATIPSSEIKNISQQPDVIFIQRYILGQEADENQALNLIDQLNSFACTEDRPGSGITAAKTCYSTGLPAAAGNTSYIDWFNSNFDLPHLPSLQLQFLEPIDIADSGIDTGIINLTTGIATNQQHRDFLYEADTTSPLARVIAGQSFTYNAADILEHLSTPIDNAATLYSNISPTGAHGTQVASVAAGFNNGPVQPAAAGTFDIDQDSNGFHYGMGISPYSRIIASRIFGNTPTGGYGMLASIGDELDKAYELGARISNHSWGRASMTVGTEIQIVAEGSYDDVSETIDSRVRDARPSIAGNQEITVVTVTGNSAYSPDTGMTVNYVGETTTPGGAFCETISSTGGNCYLLWNGPAVSKNAIVVGASEKFDLSAYNTTDCTLPFGSDSAHDWASISTAGNTPDGRFKPDLVAPGIKITTAVPLDATYPTGSNSCPELFYPQTTTQQQLYSRRFGTSFAAPAVTGAAALLRQTFTNKTVDDPADPTDQFRYANLSAPSPAMTKAWLMNTTTYLTGDMINGETAGVPNVEDLPSRKQGMGLLNMRKALDDTARIIRDQTISLSASSNHQINALLADDTRDLRITLVWTDPPADPAAASNAPKLVNNLNLEVIICSPATMNCDAGEAGALVYNGNNFTVDVSRDTSQPGNTVDSLNNVESVWLPSLPATRPNNSKIVVNVIGSASIPIGPQDFAIVIYNGNIQTAAHPASAALTIPEDATSANLWNALLTTDMAAFTSSGDTLQIIEASLSGSSDTINLDPNTSTITITADDNIHDSLSTVSDSQQITLNYTVSDGLGAIGTASATITVTGINDAPIIENDTTVINMSSIIEDLPDASNNGETVLALVTSIDGDRITDVDDSALEGIAVIGVDNSNGTWEYSVNGGNPAGSWISFVSSGVTNHPSNNGTAAVLLDTSAMSLIRFRPNLNYAGPAGELRFRGWDRTDSSASGDTGVDVSTNGNTAAYSSLFATASLEVTAVNDPPVATTQETCTAPGVPLVFSISGNDPVEGDTIDIISIQSSTASPVASNSGGQLTHVGLPSGNPFNLTYDPLALTSGMTDSFEFVVNETSDALASPSAAATVTINIDSACRRPVDVVLVLDTSGSMNSGVTGNPSESKIDLLSKSIDMFLATWGVNLSSSGTDRIGLVYFNANTQIFEPMLLDMNAINSDTLLTDICGGTTDTTVCTRTGGGATAMGAGLQEAYNLLTGGVATNSSNSLKNIILFTDGMQNRNPMVNDDATPNTYVVADIAGRTPLPSSYTSLGVNTGSNPDFAEQGIKIHSIGLGTPGTSDFYTILEQLSDLTTGAVGNARFTDDADGMLPNLWEMALVDLLSDGSLAMVGYDQGRFSNKNSSTGIKHSYPINSSAISATFILSWRGDDRADALQFALRHKKTGILIPSGTLGLNTIKRKFYTIKHLSFPLILPDGKKITADSEWEMLINGKLAVKSVNYQAWNIIDDTGINYRFDIPKNKFSVGETIKLSSLFTDKKGQPVLKKLTKATVSITSPAIGIGTFLSTNKVVLPATKSKKTVGQTTFDPDRFLNKADKKLYLLLKNPELRAKFRPTTKTKPLTINNNQSAALDINTTTVPGIYNFQVTATGIANDGSTVQRTRTFSKLVTIKSVIDGQTRFVITRVKNDTNNLQIHVTPIDKYGNYLGPGVASKLSFNADNIEKIGPVVDNLDGSYTQTFITKNLFGESIKINILDTELSILTEIDPRIYYWFIMLLLFIFVSYALFKWLKK